MLTSLVISSAAIAAVLVILGPAKVLATIAMGICLGIGVGPAKQTILCHVETVMAHAQMSSLRQKLFPAKEEGIDTAEFVTAYSSSK
jgi:predicted MFS family arabinose efflux permease